MTTTVVLALALLARPAAAQDGATPGSVVVVKVDGSIDCAQAGYLRESLADAEADGATVVVQLDSAGTLDQDAIGLAQRIHDATVPVVVWVGPAPAKARGAALLFMYAASLAGVAPGAGIGPLQPLDLVDARSAGLPSGAELEALATRWVQERGRPEPVVFPDRPVPAQAALDGGQDVVGVIHPVDDDAPAREQNQYRQGCHLPVSIYKLTA